MEKNKDVQTYIYELMTDQRSGFFDTVVQGILFAGSVVFHFGIVLRRLVYQCRLRKSHHLPVPVICVGNIALGGAGKTPLVVVIVRYLLAKGCSPVILMRGYMPKGVTAQESDEAKMLRELLPDVPICIGADRVKTAREFLKTHSADVFIMDDGFQHWPLHRDLDIVAADARFFLRDCRLFPRGILREPLSALKRAGLIVLTKTEQVFAQDAEAQREFLQKIVPHVPVVFSCQAARGLRDLKTGLPVDSSVIRDQRLGMLVSIGAPQSFKTTIQQARGNVVREFIFPDHHWYSREEIEHVVASCRAENMRIIVTTHKDAVKIRSFADIFGQDLLVLILDIETVLTDQKDLFFERINCVFSG